MSEVTQNFNFLQPSNFKVVIDRKKFGNLEFFAQRVVHPGVTVSAPIVPYKRIQSVSIARDTLGVDDLSFDVLTDENLTSYIEVYNLLESLVQTPNKNKNKLIAADEHEMDITLSILSSHNNTIKKIRYIDCVPVNIGTLLLESVGGDTPVVTFPVTFKVSYFELV